MADSNKKTANLHRLIEHFVQSNPFQSNSLIYVMSFGAQNEMVLFSPSNPFLSHKRARIHNTHMPQFNEILCVIRCAHFFLVQLLINMCARAVLRKSTHKFCVCLSRRLASLSGSEYSTGHTFFDNKLFHPNYN